MSHYGISAIHWNANLGEIDEVQLHKFVRQKREGAFALAHGEPAWCSDVVNLIRGGDTVWVMVADGAGNHKNTDHVRINIKHGGHEYLYSCTKDGTPTSALTDLPRYERPDDPPPPVHVEIEYDGKKYSGSYTVGRDNTITVTTASWGSKYALRHASTPEVLAPILLRELVEEAKRRGDL